MNHTIQILAVDDHPENLMALKGVLSVADYELVALRSGEDALRYLLLEDISRLAVILMDVQMPGMNGFETVELIKQRDRCRDIPVIFLTAISTSFDHVIQGYQIGSVDYLFKPIHPQLLRLKVDAFVKLYGYNRKIKEQGEMLRKRALELETANRKLAEAETMLKMQNERLESIVESRTFELIAANDKLLKSQERFKKMFMSSPCPIAIRCLSDFRYIDVNESWKRHTGFGDEVIGLAGNPLQEIVDPMEGDHVRLDQTLRNVRIKYTTKGNEIRDALLSTEIIEIDDEKCLLQVMIDITEKVRYEKEMARLAELNLVGEMAAGIAHEIRNPMTTIRGFLQLLDSNRGSMAKEYIQIMLGELDRANGIITEYLALAKNKQTDLKPRLLNPIIELLYPLIQAEAIMSGKHVHVEYGANVELPLDEKEIRQLILNLSMNGLEAMEPGGILRIETGTDPEAGEVVLTIADQGRGIREEDLEKLGRPFFTTKEHGTGLGLAVCYSIAARHQAAIEVESSGEGTTFRIRFRQGKA